MESSALNERIPDEAIVYRKIPVAQPWYDASQKVVLKHAFRPSNADTNRISLVLASAYNSPQEAAIGSSKQGYYIAELRVAQIRAKGMDVIHDPVDGVPGHVLVPQIRIDIKDTDEELAVRELLAKLCETVHGPFPAIPPT